ncbi:hypothetical protein LguiB_006209 [Lonicera macranthoides]
MRGLGFQGPSNPERSLCALPSVWPPERVTMSLSDRPICLINTSLKWSLPLVASGRRPSTGGSCLSCLSGWKGTSGPSVISTATTPTN